MNLPTRAGAGRPVPTVRWDPFREIEDTWTRMANLLGDVVGTEHRPYGLLAGLGPAVDIEETDVEFLVELDVPGVRSRDVSIDLRDNELFVTGEIRQREHRGVLRRQTRRVGRFEHEIMLPGDVDPDSVTASLDNGVLTIRLAKARRSQPRHIEVSEAAGAPESTGRLTGGERYSGGGTAPEGAGRAEEVSSEGRYAAGSTGAERSGAGASGAAPRTGDPGPGYPDRGYGGEPGYGERGYAD